MHCVSLLVKQEKAGRALTCGTATSTCPCLQTCVCVRTAYFRPGWSWINSHTQGQGRILALLDRSPKQGSRCAVCPAGHRGQQEQGNVTIWFDPDPEFECGGSQEQGKGQPDPLPSQADSPHWCGRIPHRVVAASQVTAAATSTEAQLNRPVSFP